MRAEVYYYAPYGSQFENIKQVLRTAINPRMEITGLPVQTEAFDKHADLYHKNATRYVRLMQAAIPPSIGLTIGVKSFVMYGFYLYSSYYPLHSGYPKFFQDEGCSYLFPAVAIQDRMVMVPKGLSRILTGSEEWVFLPMTLGGVVGAEFEEAAALEEAVKEVARRLKADVLEEVRAYSSYHSAVGVNPTELASHLGIDVDFLQEVLKVQASERSMYHCLSCCLDRQSLPLNRWTKVILTIRNDSVNSLSDLLVKITGPVKLLPVQIRARVPAHSQVDVPFAVFPAEEGEFPLEIMFLTPEDQLLQDWVPTHHIWLEV